MKEKLTHCLNCEAALPNLDNYCPNCGQKNHATLLRIRSFLDELVKSIFNVDARIWITLKTAILNIGQLVKEFNQGKRRKYVRPVQFYLFCSVFFFLLLGIDAQKNEALADATIKENIDATDTLSMNIGSHMIRLPKSDLLKVPKLSNTQLDSLLVEHKLSAGFYNRFMLQQSVKVIENGISGIHQRINSIASAGMFLLMPIMAWLLYLFFSKTYPYYVQHLVFSIYFHSIVFLFLALKVIFNIFGLHSAVDLIGYLGILIYTFIAVKQFYNKGPLKTIGYFLGLLFLYGIILLMFITLTAFISLILS